MTAQSFLLIWTAATGQSWRCLPYAVQREAEQAVAAGFTEAEVKMVVAYTRKRLARQDAGYNEQSLLWRVMAADSWAKFQERLSLAQEAAKRAQGAKPKPQIAVTTGDVTRLVEDTREREAKVIDVSAALRGLADETQRKEA